MRLRSETRSAPHHHFQLFERVDSDGRKALAASECLVNGSVWQWRPSPYLGIAVAVTVRRSPPAFPPAHFCCAQQNSVPVYSVGEGADTCGSDGPERSNVSLNATEPPEVGCDSERHPSRTAHRASDSSPEIRLGVCQKPHGLEHSHRAFRKTDKVGQVVNRSTGDEERQHPMLVNFVARKSNGG